MYVWHRLIPWKLGLLGNLSNVAALSFAILIHKHRDLDPWESQIVKIFVTIFMQISLTNAHPQGAWERREPRITIRAPIATQKNKSISRKMLAISQSWNHRRRGEKKISFIKRDLSDFKLGQRNVLRINFCFRQWRWDLLACQRWIESLSSIFFLSKVSRFLNRFWYSQPWLIYN